MNVLRVKEGEVPSHRVHSQRSVFPAKLVHVSLHPTVVTLFPDSGCSTNTQNVGVIFRETYVGPPSRKYECSKPSLPSLHTIPRAREPLVSATIANVKSANRRMRVNIPSSREAGISPAEQEVTARRES